MALSRSLNALPSQPAVRFPYRVAWFSEAKATLTCVTGVAHEYQRENHNAVSGAAEYATLGSESPR